MEVGGEPLVADLVSCFFPCFDPFGMEMTRVYIYIA